MSESEFITKDMLAAANRMRLQVNEKLAQMTPTLNHQPVPQEAVYESDARKVMDHPLVPDSLKTGEQDRQIWESIRQDQKYMVDLALAAAEGKSPRESSEAKSFQRALAAADNKGAPQVFDPTGLKVGDGVRPHELLPLTGRGDVRRDLVQVWNDKGQLIDEHGDVIVDETERQAGVIAKLAQDNDALRADVRALTDQLRLLLASATFPTLEAEK